ncbi:MAG TPA: diacylglycerol kinase family protein [Solirubrobacterales bacterium]|nr:diacylglycerol kinase family protein [Solirubrobacterales bacterium]
MGASERSGRDRRSGRELNPRQRAAAVAALVLPPAVLILALTIVVAEFPRGLIVLGCAVVAIGAAFYGVMRTGSARVFGLGVALAASIGAALVLVTDGDHIVEAIAVVAGVGVATYATRTAFRVRVHLPPAPAPAHPVLLYNPKSGGGKAERFSLADEAAKRGIESVELTRGADLEKLVRDAVAGGADALAMAGGDGSQAVVASIASELDLPYACIPAGTRNHFALDLGVDRDDVVGALDALVEGGERRVDLAEVNGRVFVNNVSLGLYAEAVQRDEYRDAKLRTILNTVPEALGPDGAGLDLAWTGPEGDQERSGAALLISNNRYRLGRGVGSGTRPRIDAGVLGVTVVSAPPAPGSGQPRKPWREWSATEFDIDSSRPVPAGVDGEAMTLEPPLRFRIRPGALRVRIAPAHPGASPSAAIPEGFWDGVRTLAGVAAGRAPVVVDGHR